MSRERAADLLDRLRSSVPTRREALLSTLGDASPRLRTTFERLLAEGESVDGLFSDEGALAGPLGASLLSELDRLPATLGEVVGSVELIEVLGEGGMGTVFRGHDAKLGRDVAVKTVRAERRPDEAARARFRREARLLSQLNHSGICQIYDLIEGERADYLVLELIEGQSLGEWRAMPRTLSERLTVALRIAEAVAAAHERRIVHRDLKPDNVMVTESGEVKVLDFGIARAAEASALASAALASPGLYSATEEASAEPAHPSPASARTEPASAGSFDPAKETWRTRHGAVIGTLGYMSPEQARGEPVDAASDVFSLGLIFQELFADAAAYPRVADDELLELVRRGESAPMEGVDPPLARLITAMKAPERTARPAAEEVVTALREVLEAPARRRLQRLRRVGAAMVVATALAGLTAFVLSRVDAARRSRLALELSQFAAEIEWRLRAEYLAPLHDVSAVEAEMRSRVDELEGRVARMPRGSRPLAHAAAGRAYLALGEPERARAHFESARAAGDESAEVAAGLGRALAEIYSLRLGALGDAVLRPATADYRSQLERELARPALDLLRQGRSSTWSPAAYVEELIAAFELRWDEVAEKRSAAVEAAPWFYEAPLFESAVMGLRLSQALRGSDFAAGAKQAELTLAALQEAAAIARSSPRALAARCETGALLASYYLGTGRRDDAQRQLAEAEPSCRGALVAGPNAARVLVANATFELFRLNAKWPEVEPDEYTEPESTADRAVALAPEEAAPYHLRGYARRIRSGLSAARGEPLPEVAAAALSDFERAFNLEPRENWRRSFYLEGLILEGWTRWWDGGDPESALQEALRVAAEGLDQSPEFVRFAHDRALAGTYLALYSAEIGRDALPVAEQAARDCEKFVGGESSESLSDCGLVAVNLATLQVEAGVEPSAALESTRHWTRRAREASPRNDVAWFVTGLADFLEARWQMLHGGDPEPGVEAAIEAYRRGFEINPRNGDAPFELAEIYLLQARYDLDRGRSAEVALGAAKAQLENALRSTPDHDGTHRVDARRWLTVARAERQQRRDPTAALRRAEAAAERAAAIRPTAEAFSLRAEALARMASAAMERQRDASAEIEAGVAAVEKALALNSRHPRALAAGAALEHLDQRGGSSAAATGPWSDAFTELAAQRPHLLLEHAALRRIAGSE